MNRTAAPASAAATAKAASVDSRQVECITAADAVNAAHQTSFFGAPTTPGMLHNNTLFRRGKSAW